jgi:hypothetical protein
LVELPAFLLAKIAFSLSVNGCSSNLSQIIGLIGGKYTGDTLGLSHRDPVLVTIIGFWSILASLSSILSKAAGFSQTRW